MRKEQQQEYVRPITTGHVEADMLGHIYLWVSERTNSKYAQRSHRTYKRRQPKSIFRVAIECIQTAPSALLRKLQIPKCDHNCHKCSFLCSLRRVITNGK